MFVHHPDKDYAETEQVGARRVQFEKGRAEIGVPHLERHYRRAGYSLTDGKRRPGAAGEADAVEADVVVEADPPFISEGDEG